MVQKGEGELAKVEMNLLWKAVVGDGKERVELESSLTEGRGFEISRLSSTEVAGIHHHFNPNKEARENIKRLLGEVYCAFSLQFGKSSDGVISGTISIPKSFRLTICSHFHQN